MLAIASAALADPAPPTDDPAAGYKLPWTSQLRWATVVSIDTVPGNTPTERLAAAQVALAAKGGGVVYFPPGTYRFDDSILLKSGVVLRGATPSPVTDAKQEAYEPPTKFEFPKYEPKLEGDGTPIDTAFKAIQLEDAATAENCGLVNLSIDHAHVSLAEGADHAAGRNRLVYGCVVRNAAVAKHDIPDASIGQHAWQRYTEGHVAAIGAYSGENLLIANNRLPESGQDNFLQKGYLLLDRQKKPATPDDGVLFDYDNRPGIRANAYGIGGAGNDPPDGTPEIFPWGFRKGIVVRDNFIFSTGRCAVSFTGDGVYCAFNVIRFKPDVLRVTNTGKALTAGSSTNDNRAVEMRGWRWTVEGNDYLVYRNRCADKKFYINDGEGLMHEDHVNSTILDSKLINNKGNAYLSLFCCGGINGLEIRGNDIRPDGPGTDKKISSIFCVADRLSKGTRFECRNVSIVDNVTAGTGIRISGDPAENNVVRGNRSVTDGGKIINDAKAVLEGNEGYTVETATWKPRKK